MPSTATAFAHTHELLGLVEELAELPCWAAVVAGKCNSWAEDKPGQERLQHLYELGLGTGQAGQATAPTGMHGT